MLSTYNPTIHLLPSFCQIKDLPPHWETRYKNATCLKESSTTYLKLLCSKRLYDPKAGNVPIPKLYPKNICVIPSIHVWADFSLLRSVCMRNIKPSHAPSKVTARTKRITIIRYGNKAVNQTTYKIEQKTCLRYVIPYLETI